MASDPTPSPKRSSAEIRDELAEALELDLVGPWPEHELDGERLPGWVRPSNWYLTGFLIPSETPPNKSSNDDADDEMEEVPESGGAGDENAEDRKAAKKGFFPASMGLSVLVPGGSDSLKVTVDWGDYSPEEIDSDGKRVNIWQRTARQSSLELALKEIGQPKEKPVPKSDGLVVSFLVRSVPDSPASDLPAGTRSVSVFLVNRREPNPDRPDLAYAFQPVMKVASSEPFVPRPDLRGTLAEEWDEQVADLHYADAPEYATGHGVSADWDVRNGECRLVRTAWVPRAKVSSTKAESIEDVQLSMAELGALPDGSAAAKALTPLVDEYRKWIKKQEGELDELQGTRRETAEQLLRNASIAADRIASGIGTLVEDGDALDAFRLANRAVASALQRRLGVVEPAWRPFQLAFILLNLPGLADASDKHRETVDLLFFPTGGGKTEAYLGLSAFAIVLRRLRHPEENGKAGAGVSVIMRYTLRLLTLDQLARAAGLLCALELEREGNPERYGSWPFEIGLWVGKAATANTMGKKGDKRSDTARAKVRQYKNDPKNKPSPIPLESCPWCETPFKPESFTLLPNDDDPEELRIVCTNFECDFTGGRTLPIVAIDDQIYRRLPAFLIATVDKFATLPWVGRDGLMLGNASTHDDGGFYGPVDPGTGTKLEQPLLPPDLVVQDELHLISGPLGTMTGLYEAAIEGLASRHENGATVRPKIVASTATVRRAQDQIQALFARPLTQIFPPPGPTRQHSFFARTASGQEVQPRLYVGIAAQGRNPKVVMRRVWLALMAAAERAYRDAGGHKDPDNPADPYMTVLGYFNSLRELGGARRILEEEVQNTLKSYGQHRRIGEKRGLFQDRKSFSEVVELTSRVPTNKVADARRRLGTSFDQRDRVDCAIATNMISVGLDIPRLGLMGVIGQPKTTAEYIQATSRVGRDDEKPGLVVTLLNVHKPRDRSHYERFRHYHETFYRSVEAGSVTPFSARALDRGLAGALVSLARHLDPALTPPLGAEEIKDHRAELETRLLKIFQERVQQQPIAEDEREERVRSIQNRVADLLDSWTWIYEDYKKDGVALQYQRYELDQPRPLLREILEEVDSAHRRKFRVNRSLRDVEPEVNLFLKDLGGDSGDNG